MVDRPSPLSFPSRSCYCGFFFWLVSNVVDEATSPFCFSVLRGLVTSSTTQKLSTALLAAGRSILERFEWALYHWHLNISPYPQPLSSEYLGEGSQA